MSLAPSSLAREIYVSNQATEAGQGTKASPFRSLQKAMEQLKAGDTCYLRAGAYSEAIKLSELKGTADQPITIKAYPGESVSLTATKSLELQWSLWKDGIYRARCTDPVWQLFSKDKLVEVARWPNATLEDGSIWKKNQAMRYSDRKFKKGKPVGDTRDGVIHDKSPEYQIGQEGLEEEVEYDNDFDPNSNKQTLAEIGLCFKGGLAVLNIGHWITWTRPITEHKAGSNLFKYDAKGTKMSKHVTYYLLGLAALDQVNEWWYDKDEKVIYYKPPAGKRPEQMDLKAKAFDYCLLMTDCSYVKVEGIDFFAGTFQLDGSDHCEIRDARFLYPSTNKFLLGIYKHFTTRPSVSNTAAMQSNVMSLIHNHGQANFDNKIFNCEFSYANSPAVAIESPGSSLENSLLQYIEWDVNSNGSAGSVITGDKTIVKNNEIHTAGASEGLRPGKGSLVTLNKVSNMSLLQFDGAAINVGTHDQVGTRISHNWVFDSKQQGIRFDSTKSAFGSEGTVDHNVIFNCVGGSKFKGDKHYVGNNTVFDTYLALPSSYGDTGVHNKNSLVRNNLCSELVVWKSGHSDKHFTAKLEHNFQANVKELLRDVNSWDFRPSNNAKLIDSGLVSYEGDMPSNRVPFYLKKYNNEAPDLGAYEYGDLSYWIPGRKYKQASQPIVSVDKQGGVELMFQQALDADMYSIHLSTDEDSLKKVSYDDETRKSRQKNNIFEVGPLFPGQYYWRVDSYVDGEVQRGKVWSFSLEANGLSEAL